MHHVHEIMSRDVVNVTPNDTIQHAAELMRRYDVGSLPVCQNHRLIGMITDRDLAVRALSTGCPANTPVRDFASTDVQWCFDDDDVDAVQQRMATAQVRRMPVVDHDKNLVGALSLGDIATRADSASRDEVANTLEGVSQPRMH
ncbi:CBS domain-containing protein [Paraburkholderia sp. 22099]|jgi:CBS domain-containing protein|uniref:CBS domain-containing protein n=1 Tax=Paraburkholderia terricola TaxID=169427 RepID=A0A1M6MVG3_9BURK|nr:MULTISPECIES: CBS domain-containing protein [Paraburkholderia]ORC52510.1 CBS domain-containing protein [Burkholderia sp. A27]AXE96487.1 CBS domain-containing protein [Paraburkholderia terricola]MDR6409237.1 CBS domain-containing protein [Paraburkholderia terricola]MDR6448954.1 CBS domain-containing protein [Paraburkholderia terricola]MDR6482500.1 CBS domain-containing protein [Paraburkholderia terricola]